MIDARASTGVPLITTARPAAPKPQPTSIFGIDLLPWQSTVLFHYAGIRVQDPARAVVVTGAGA